MLDFEFYAPTRVFFGKGAEMKVAEAVKWAGGSRVLLVYGIASAKKSGLIDCVEAQLNEAGIPFDSVSGVRPNPRLSLAREGIKKAEAFGADLILAIGGGSSIDTAKAIALGAANPGKDIWDFWLAKELPQKVLPVGVILTIAATGSETSYSSVLTDDETLQKRGFNNDINRPKFALMNPELTFNLPINQLSNGIADIMLHTLDRYFTEKTGNDFTDALGELVLRSVMDIGPKLLKAPNDYHLLSELMWCGSVSHNNLTGLGGIADFSVHALSYPLSGIYDIAHAPALTAVWGSWAEYVMPADPGRFAKLGREVFGDDNDYAALEDAALAAISQMVEFFKSINMPTDFSSVGVGVLSDEVVQDFADYCSYNGGRKIGNFRPVDRDDIYEIFKMANK